MEHRIILGSNSRLWVFVGFMVALVGVAVWCVVQFGPLPGAIAVACVVFLDYRIGKWLRNVLRSGIETSAQGAKISLSNGKSLFMAIEDLTVTGSYTEQSRPGVFLFADATDQFFACSDTFSNFPQLEAWLREHTVFEEHPDLDMAGIKAMLRQRYGEPEPEAEETKPSDEPQ